MIFRIFFVHFFVIINVQDGCSKITKLKNKQQTMLIQNKKSTKRIEINVNIRTAGQKMVKGGKIIERNEKMVNVAKR